LVKNKKRHVSNEKKIKQDFINRENSHVVLNIKIDTKSAYRIIKPLERPPIPIRHRPIHLDVISFITHFSEADAAEVIILFTARKKKEQRGDH
jgi:hypothetical protein